MNLFLLPLKAMSAVRIMADPLLNERDRFDVWGFSFSLKSSAKLCENELPLDLLHC